MGLRLMPSRGPTRLTFAGEYEALSFLNYYAERYPGIDVRSLPDAEIGRVYRAWRAADDKSNI